MNIKLVRYIVVAALIAAFVLTSCAETPQEDIVENKGEGKLENLISNSQGIGIDANEDSEESRQVCTFASDNGAVVYNFDAEVVVPKTNAVPVLQVTPHFFTPDELGRIANAVFGNVKIYEYTERLSKPELEKIILMKRQQISDRNVLLEYYQNDEEMVNHFVSMVEREISAIEDDYKSAPDSTVLKDSDFQFHEDSYYSSENSSDYFDPQIKGVETVKATSVSDNIPYYMYACKRNDDSYRASNLYIYPKASLIEYSLNPKSEFSYYQTDKITAKETDEAKLIVENFLKTIDMGHFVIDTYEQREHRQADGSCTYSICFTCVPEYSGISVADVSDIWTPNSEFRSDYIDTHFVVFVSNGRIMTVWYESPIDVKSNLNDNVCVLSVDDAVEQIKKQLQYKWTPGYIRALYDYDTNIEITSAEMNITKIRFTYVRTMIKDNADDFYLMPAWMVYGNYAVREYTMGNNTITLPQNDNDVPLEEVLLIINAVDGSYIDLSQGY